MLLKLLFILVLIPGIFMRVMAHEEGSEQDTIYRLPTNIAPHKTVAGKFIHRLLLDTKIPTMEYDQQYLGKRAMPYQELEGKIIRHIHISSIDPFGFSLQDTAVHPQKFLQHIGNTFHISTKEKTIANLLLFHTRQPFDSLVFKESERIIRSQKYVQDVYTYAKQSVHNDSVDIYIQVIDIWSIIPTFRRTGQSYSAGLADNNFLGSGNRFHADTRFGHPINGMITQMGYIIPNIGNSHITGSLQYYFEGNNDLLNHPSIRNPAYSSLTYNLPTLTLSNRYFIRSIELYRPFFSPLTKWAGGIFAGQFFTRQNYTKNDTVRFLSSKTTIQDYWAAVSFPIYKNHTLAARTSAIIFSLRVLRAKYPDAIPVSESIRIFENENFYFAGIGITSRRFIQDRYVFNYGKVEDIPIGRSFGITTGMHVQKTKLFYLGLIAAFGNNYPFGYFSTHLAYGTFFSSKGFSQQVITGKANYYTRLFSVNYWKIRQFIQPTVIIGLDRLPTDNLSLEDVIEGFEEIRRPASKMIALTLQTQSYAPFEIFGFRLGPYFFSTLGMLSHHRPEISGNRLYSAMGLGVLIKNNHLLVNTFQLSLTYYPFLPESGYHVFNLNAYKTSDYGLNDFEISKPQVVEYR